MKKLLIAGTTMFLAVSISGQAQAMAMDHYLEYSLTRIASNETGVYTYAPITTVSVEPFYPREEMFGGSASAGGYMYLMDAVEYGSFSAWYDGQIDFPSGTGWVDLSARRKMKWVDTVTLASDTLEQGTQVPLLATLKGSGNGEYAFESDNGSSDGFSFNNSYYQLQSSMLVQASIGEIIRVTGTWEIENGIYTDAENAAGDGYVEAIWGDRVSFYIDPQIQGVHMTSASGMDYRGFYIAETNNNGGNSHAVPEASTLSFLISTAGCVFAGKSLRKKTQA